MSLNILERLILSQVSKYKEKELKFAIKNNVSLANLVLSYRPEIVKLAMSLSSIYKPENGILSMDNVMKYMQEKRPDLSKVILESRANYRWLETQFFEIKRLLRL